MFGRHLVGQHALEQQALVGLSRRQHRSAVSSRGGRFGTRQIQPPFLSVGLWQSRQRRANNPAICWSNSRPAGVAATVSAGPAAARMSISVMKLWRQAVDRREDLEHEVLPLTQRLPFDRKDAGAVLARLGIDAAGSNRVDRAPAARSPARADRSTLNPATSPRPP